MKIAVMGSGGVGGYFGGMLAYAGHDVTFIARGAHLRAIRARGLRVDGVQSSFTIAPANATDEPEEVGPVEVVLLCVKNYDLLPVIDQIRPLVASDTMIITLQNGVDAPDVVASVFGGDMVLPGLVYCEVGLKEPGVIVQGSPFQRIIVGERDGSVSPRAQMFVDACAAAGVEAVLSENVLGALWSKFCFICAMGGVTALTRRPIGPVLADEEGCMLFQAVMEEIYTLALAQGIRFDTDPVAGGMATAARFPDSAKSSMQRDLERGGRLEIESLNGAVVRRGRAFQVATPINQAIYAALRLVQVVGLCGQG